MRYLDPPSARTLRLVGEQLPGRPRLRHVRQFRGGLGCTNDLVEVVGDAPGAVRAAVLRRYGPGHGARGPAAAVREAAALRLAATGGCPVPVVLWSSEGTGARPFPEAALLLVYVAGSPWHTPTDQLGWAHRLADAAAAIHRVQVGREESPQLHDRSRHAVMAEAAPSDRFRTHPLGDALWHRRRELFEGGTIGADDQRTLVHNDFHPGNLLWLEEEITAVVDWEEAAYGDPVADIAYCASDMHYLGMDDAAKHFTARYVEQTGRSLDGYEAWMIVALCRPLPDIGRWLPSWQETGRPELSANELRDRYDGLVERVLQATAT